MDGWKQTLNGFPRVELATYPTPMEFLPRLSQEVGHPIYIKRDDLIGPGLGGNKTRKLEFLLAEALQKSERRILTFGGLQSNHARITAAAARKCGLEPHLIYFERRPARLSGNLLLNSVLGAKMYFIPLGETGNNLKLETTIRLVRWLARLLAGRHYFVPVGGHNWLGCLGYVQAALEIDEQARELGIEKAHLIVAAGSGGTLAGLKAGFELIKSPLKLVGIDVGKLWKGFPNSISRLANEICYGLGCQVEFTARDVPIIEETYVGSRYGFPTQDGLMAIKLLARLEGMLLDPVYTAKAFAGLLDMIAKGRFNQDEPLIFLHTGGYPALFAYERELLSHG